jgi:hypothetical protein
MYTALAEFFWGGISHVKAVSGESREAIQRDS